ncbi:MAG TPA: hypothetical protein VGG27_02795 [Magnetospirillaceae bacterium]|jgi:hypothetical protein
MSASSETRNTLKYTRWLWGMFFLFLAAQIWVSISTRNLRVAVDDMPSPPSVRSLKAMAFGDDEFLFRYLGRWLQFIGDGGGRIKPLRDYDYDRVVYWAEALDALDDNKSDYIHELMARYFGEITVAVDPKSERLGKVVGYLHVVALNDPAHFWKWLVWVANKARNPMRDGPLIEAIARDLQSPELKTKAVPAWVRVLPVRLYLSIGERDKAQAVLDHITPEDRAEIEAQKRALDAAVAQGKRLMNNSGQPAQPAK